MQLLAAPDRHYCQRGERGTAVTTRKYPDGRDGAPAQASRAVRMARRRLLLVTAGGVAIGVATVTGRGGGGRLAPSALNEAPHTAPTHTPPKATNSPKPVRTARRASSVRPARTIRTEGGQPMYYVDDGLDVIALTIDDGPSPVYTPQVLSILEKYDIKAAFSMVGENVTYYPSVAPRGRGRRSHDRQPHLESRQPHVDETEQAARGGRQGHGRDPPRDGTTAGHVPGAVRGVVADPA